jgi:hypothetical protein
MQPAVSPFLVTSRMLSDFVRVTYHSTPFAYWLLTYFTFGLECSFPILQALFTSPPYLDDDHPRHWRQTLSAEKISCLIETVFEAMTRRIPIGWRLLRCKSRRLVWKRGKHSLIFAESCAVASDKNLPVSSFWLEQDGGYRRYKCEIETEGTRINFVGDDGSYKCWELPFWGSRIVIDDAVAAFLDNLDIASS